MTELASLGIEAKTTGVNQATSKLDRTNEELSNWERLILAVEIDKLAIAAGAMKAENPEAPTSAVSSMTSCGSVLEIGGGLGRSAFYCHLAGIDEYSIVDIPLTGAAQAYFLGRVLGEDKVCLFGEEPTRGAIRLIPPGAVYDVACDLSVNVDSVTEIDRSAAGAYVDHVLARSKVILSSNHEMNDFTFNELVLERDPTAKILRNVSLVRAGYIEEIVIR